MGGQLAELLALRWTAVLRAYSQAPLEVREKVVALQTEFADTSGNNAGAVRHLARHAYGAKLFAGSSDARDPDSLPAGGHPLTESEIEAVVTSMAVNAADTLPDGSEALFYVGALLEHSCAPNTKFVVYTAEDAPPERDVAHLPASSWVGEWRAISAIQEGDAVTTSYLENEILAQTREARQRMLFLRMGFHCRCTRCVEEQQSLPLDPCELRNLRRTLVEEQQSLPLDPCELSEAADVHAVFALSELD